MRSGNLFNLLQGKMTESQLNTIYTMITGLDSYSHPDSFPENEVSPVQNGIECGWTMCRLKSIGDPIPEDIERCL